MFINDETVWKWILLINPGVVMYLYWYVSLFANKLITSLYDDVVPILC
jgi:hypothetical protein